ncbi:MAG: hypothetical protein ABJN84_08960 [Flavobacteriaceae bacterium]
MRATIKKKTELFFSFAILLNLVFFYGEAQEKKVIRKVDFSSEIKDFKRSSLHILMVETPEKEKLNTIKNTFEGIPIPEKFNKHSLGFSFVAFEEEAKDHSLSISKKLKEAQLAKKLIAKWFNRNKKGGFNLELIKERGLYNASAFDIQIAQQTLRGNAMLEDAGEQLIASTFVIVNDYKYTNKEEVISKGKNILGDITSIIGKKNMANSVTVQAAGVLKGYVIKTTSYLYRLVWDAETSAQFFGTLWVTNENYDKEIVDAFDESDIFKLEYIGRQDAWADVQSTKYSSKSDEELIERATIKATNAAIAKLERKFEVFRTKTPIISVEPIAAKIGSKEGLKKGDRFEVLEQMLLENGTVEYKKVMEIAVDHNQIWDNSYLPEEVPESDIEYTVFKGNSKKLYPGMLIRYKRNQNLFK